MVRTVGFDNEETAKKASGGDKINRYHVLKLFGLKLLSSVDGFVLHLDC